MRRRNPAWTRANPWAQKSSFSHVLSNVNMAQRFRSDLGASAPAFPFTMSGAMPGLVPPTGLARASEFMRFAPAAALPAAPPTTLLGAPFPSAPMPASYPFLLDFLASQHLAQQEQQKKMLATSAMLLPPQPPATLAAHAALGSPFLFNAPPFGFWGQSPQRDARPQTSTASVATQTCDSELAERGRILSATPVLSSTLDSLPPTSAPGALAHALEILQVRVSVSAAWLSHPTLPTGAMPHPAQQQGAQELHGAADDPGWANCRFALERMI